MTGRVLKEDEILSLFPGGRGGSRGLSSSVCRSAIKYVFFAKGNV